MVERSTAGFALGILDQDHALIPPAWRYAVTDHDRSPGIVLVEHQGHKSFALFHEPARNPKTELVLIFVEEQNLTASDAASSFLARRH